MKRHTILTALLKHQFRRHKSDDGGPFGLYVRFYPVISTAVYFNHSTGQLYAIRYENDEQMYQLPELLKEQIDILQSMNVKYIVKPADFERAMVFFDFRVETEILGLKPERPFETGERVVCWHPKRGYNVGAVLGYVTDGVVIEIEFGHITVPVHHAAQVKNTWTGVPGAWDLIKDLTFRRIAAKKHKFKNGTDICNS